MSFRTARRSVKKVTMKRDERMNGRRPVCTLMLVALTGLTLAACGGDDSGGSQQGVAETTTTTEATVDTSEDSTTTTLATTEITDTTLDTGTTLQAGVATTSTTSRPSSGTRRTTTTTAKPSGGGGKTTTTTTTVASGGGTRNSGTIRLGALGAGVNASTGARNSDETRKIAEAWEARINTAGGINGYKIDVIYKDGGGDTARTVNAVKELEAAGAVGIIGQTVNAQIPAAMPFLEQKKMPLIGGVPFFAESETSPMFFPISGNYSSGLYGIVSAANHAGAKNFRKLYCTENPACQGSEPPMRNAAGRLGIKFSSQAASAVKADYTAECISAKNAGVDFLQVDGPPLATVVRDCSRQSFHPMWGGALSGSGQALIDSTQGEQYTNALFELGIFFDFPELDDFKALVKTTNLTTDTTSQTSLRPYQAFRMTEKIIGKMSGPNPSRADFLQAVYQVKGETLGGMLAAPGVDYSVQKDPSKHASNDCWTEFTIAEGKLKPTNARGNVTTNAATNWQCGSGFYDANGMPVKYT